MNLIAQIKQAQLTARKEYSTLKANLLTTLIGEAEAVGKNAANRAPTDAEVQAVVKKFIKGCDFILEKVSDIEAITSATQEKAILEEYLPKQLSEDDLRNVISNLIAIHGVDSERKLGIVMRELKVSYEGQYDGSLASRMAKAILEK